MNHRIASPERHFDRMLVSEVTLDLSQVRMAADAIEVKPAGAGAPIDNRQPYTCVNMIIALVGVYPQRS